MGDYSTSLIDEIQSDLQDVGLLNYPYYRPLGEANWAFILGWHQGLGCFTGLVSSLGLVSGPARLFFKPYHVL